MVKSGNLIRLFVSSTFADFAIEREVLQHTVFPALRDLCSKEGFILQPIDLRWGISQEATHEGRALSICFEEIRRCQELSSDLNFLILLGDRYGSHLLPESIPTSQYHQLEGLMDKRELVLLQNTYREDRNMLPEPVFVLLPRPEGHRNWEVEVATPLLSSLAKASIQAGFTWEEALPYIGSVTHQEIQQGLFSAGCDPSAVVCVFRSFRKISSKYLILPFLEMDKDGRSHLAQLKAAIRARLGDRVYSYNVAWTRKGPKFDRAELSLRLYNILETRVLEIIAQRKTSDPRNSIQVTNQDFSRESMPHFIGRTEALDTIADSFTERNECPLIVTGQSGIGKSTLLAESVRRATEKYPHATIITRFIGITPNTSTLYDLLVGLWNEISGRYGAHQLRIPIEDAQLIKEFPLILQRATYDQPLILVIDALDQLSELPQRVDWLPDRLPPYVHIVVSILLERTELSLLRGRLPPEAIYTMDAMSLEEGEHLMDQWLKDAKRHLQLEQREAVLAGFEAEGSPLYLRLATHEALNWRSFDPAITLPKTIPELLRNFFARLEQDSQHGLMLVRHVLGYLWASKKGLAESELLDVLAWDDAVRADLHRLSPHSPPVDPALPLPVVLWARLRADLDPHLTNRDADGEKLITFYHQQLFEVVKERYLSDEDKKARHRNLAHYFGLQLLKVGSLINQRLLSELPYQQKGGELWEELYHTLTDANFLETKIANQGTRAVLADLAFLSNNREIEVIANAIHAGSLVLGQKPDELVNQVQGRTGGDKYLHNLPPNNTPRLRLLFPSLTPADSAQLRIFGGHKAGVKWGVFNPDGRFILSASADGTLRLWDAFNGDTVTILSGHSGEVLCCAFSPDGHYILSGGDDHTLRLWDGISGDELHLFSGHGDKVTICAFSPDGRQILSAADNGELRLWDAGAGNLLKVFPTPNELELHILAFSLDWQFGLNTFINRHDWDWEHEDWPSYLPRIWSIESGMILTQLPHGFPRFSLTSGGFSPDGSMALFGWENGKLELYDVENSVNQWEKFPFDFDSDKDYLRTFSVSKGPIYACAFSPDGRLIISSSGDHTLQLWSVATGKMARTFFGHSEKINCITFSADGRRVLTASDDSTLCLWELDSLLPLSFSSRHTDRVSACAFSLDGQRALTASEDRTLHLWNVSTGETILILSGHDDIVSTCAFSPDGRWGLSASRDGTLRVWDLNTGELLRILSEDTSFIYLCAFSPNGHLAMSASESLLITRGRMIRVWDVFTGELIRTFEGYSKVNACIWKADGRSLLSILGDQAVREWDIATGQCLRAFSGPKGCLAHCTFSGDGKFALSTTYEARMWLWETATAKIVKKYTAHPPSTYEKYTVHSPGTFRYALSFDGHYGITLSGDQRSLRLWEVASGQEIAQWLTDVNLECCAFSPDGQRIIAGDEHGGVHFLQVISQKINSADFTENSHEGDLLVVDSLDEIWPGHFQSFNLPYAGSDL